MPAAGSTAIGSIRLLPSRCNWAKPGIRSPDLLDAWVVLITTRLQLAVNGIPDIERSVGQRSTVRRTTARQTAPQPSTVKIVSCADSSVPEVKAADREMLSASFSSATTGTTGLRPSVSTAGTS